MADNTTVERGNIVREAIKRSIVGYINEHGYPPTVREIGDMVGLKSTSSVQSHLKRMIEAGELETDAGFSSPRAIRVPGSKDETKEQLAEYIIKNAHFCPIPIELKCVPGFKQPGCKECLMKHSHLLQLPKED